MRIAIIGGGLMGCSAALALAARGARVTIFEQADGLLQRAATAGEAKIHLGYVYANDPSLATARKMITGALTFAPFFRRYVSDTLDFRTSAPFFYAVHRNSILTAEAVGHHLRTVHAQLFEAASADPRAYFGAPLSRGPAALSARRLDELFDAEHIVRAFRTEEVAIDSRALAVATTARIEDDPACEIRLRSTVRAVAEGHNGLMVVASNDGTEFSERFDHVVNAAWAGRLAIDQTMGLLPARPWLFRLKYGISMRPGSAPPSLTSATFVLGPFGDVVKHRDDSIYLSWYPVCMTARSRRISPPPWRGRVARARRQQVVAASLSAMRTLMPALSAIDSADVAEAQVKGAAIFAWGRTDIDDPGSELHSRSDIGVERHNAYRSVDPGKLTMVPWFAERCAEQIFG